MNEDEIRAMVEQIDPEGDISDAKKEELIAKMMERYLVPNEAELGTLPDEEPVRVSDDWRVNAANAARNISKDLNIL